PIADVVLNEQLQQLLSSLTQYLFGYLGAHASTLRTNMMRAARTQPEASMEQASVKHSPAYSQPSLGDPAFANVWPGIRESNPSLMSVHPSRFQHIAIVGRGEDPRVAQTLRSIAEHLATQGLN